MTPREQDALKNIHRRVYTPERLLPEYRQEFSDQLMNGTTPLVAHLMAIALVNERTERLKGKKAETE